jgi:pyridoxine 4-dehydrogenase
MTFDDFMLGGQTRINRMGFGAMRLAAGTWGGPVRATEAGRAVLRRAVEHGVNHIDTAAFYERGGVSANELIREALWPYAAGLVIATKVGPLRDESGFPSLQAGAGRLRALVEDELRQLRLDRFELVYLRVGGMAAPGGESLDERFEVLAALREEGLIRHLGVSHVDAAQLAEARAIAPVAAVQNNFNIQYAEDVALRDHCADLGIAYVPYFPIGGGQHPLDLARLEKIAARRGGTARQVALAWLLTGSPATLAIPGTGDLAHLEENLAAARLALTEQDLADLAA